MRLALEKVFFGLNGFSIVKDVSLVVKSGEIVGLLGPNGAGKTSTFNLFIGLLRPDKGEVLLEGQQIGGFSMPRRARLGIGYLPQEPCVFRNLTVKENLEIALSLSPFRKRANRTRSDPFIL